MKTRDAVTKVRMGHDYTDTTGTECSWMHGDAWVQVDESGRVRCDERGRVKTYDARWMAEAAAQHEHGTEGEPRWPERAR